MGKPTEVDMKPEEIDCDDEDACIWCRRVIPCECDSPRSGICMCTCGRCRVP